MTSAASTDSGDTTIGPAKRAWALIGTSKRASTSGQTTGPPAENAYAVEPVGVAKTMPSQPQRDKRPSVDLGHQVEHPLSGGLLDGRLVEGPCCSRHRAILLNGDVDGHPWFYPVMAGQNVIDGVGQHLRLGLGEEPNVAKVDAERAECLPGGRARPP